MSLSSYVGKQLKVITKYDKVFEGKAVSFTAAADSDLGCDEIEIDQDAYYEAIPETDVASISIID